MKKKKSKAMASKGEKVVEKPKTYVQARLEATRPLYRLAARRVASLQMRITILECMDKHAVSVSSLAEKLGWPEETILACLNNTEDLSLRTIANIFTAMGSRLHLDLVKNIPENVE